MKILVTGGAGFIGSHTLVQLLRAGHEVIVYDSFANSKPQVLDQVKLLTSKDFPSIKGDLLERDLLNKTFAEHRPDAVIHFAGLKAVGESVEKPLDYYQNNVTGTLELLTAMETHGCHNIVFSSSATVYGTPKYLPYDEEHPLSPESPYGRTKFFVEKIIEDWTISNPQASAILLRYFNPVGADDSALIGEDPSGIPNNLVPYIAQVASGVLPHLQVLGDDYETRDGTGERDYVHVVDLAAAHLAAINYATSQTGCDAINIGTGTSITVMEFLKAFEKTVGKPLPYKIKPRRSGDVAKMEAKVDKAKALLQWESERNLENMCETTWRWQRYKMSSN